jgi:alanyl-tRNA synthetase
MKNIYNELLKMRKGYVGIFVGSDEEGYRYNAGGDGLDARILAAKMREELSAKGGGSPEMIQGKVNASQKAIEELFVSLI